MMSLKKPFILNNGNLQKYLSKNPVVRIMLNRFLKNLSDVVNSEKITDILDIGCGEGQVIYYLEKHNATLRFEGVDISEKAIEIAKKINPNVNFIVKDVYDLQYKDDSFDLVMMIEVLEHLRYPE